MILSILSLVIVSVAFAIQVYLYFRTEKKEKRDCDGRFFVHEDVIVDKIEMREDGLLLIDGKPLFCEHHDFVCGDRCHEFGSGITDNRFGRFFICGYARNAYFVKRRCCDCSHFHVDPMGEPKEGHRRYGVMHCDRDNKIIPAPCSWFEHKQRKSADA